MFASGSHKHRESHPEFYGLPISDESEQRIWSYVRKQGFEVIAQPYCLGDVSFHSGWCLHRADGNDSRISRDAHTMQYVGSQMKWSERIGIPRYDILMYDILI
eukprot:SAG31_NODE_838_length_11617_cov_36.512936_5_plen_103_part_00